MADPVQAATAYQRRLALRARSSSFLRFDRKLRDVSDGDDVIGRWVDVLRVIALVEAQERPPLVRAVEWCAHWTVKKWRPVTTGPLQLHRGPWDCRSMSYAAVSLLSSSGCVPELNEKSLHRIAVVWHGASTRQRGCDIGYLEALRTAAAIITTTARHSRAGI